MPMTLRYFKKCWGRKGICGETEWKIMSLLEEIINHNKDFVSTRKYKDFQTSRFPDKRMVVLSCMDTRLVELLPKAMNMKNGDFKLIKNAGAVISHPFGSVMRSILVAIYELKAKEVLVIGHHECGMSNVNTSQLISKFHDRGIPEETIKIIEHSGIKLSTWLKGFEKVEDSVENSVDMIRKHPLTPKDVFVHGLVIDPKTGKLDVIVDGYKAKGKI